MHNSEIIQVMKSQVGGVVTKTPSPFMRWLQPVLVYAEPGDLVFEYQVRKEMTNPFGTLHGGITAAIIDDAMGATLISLGDEVQHITVNLNVDYFSSAREGDIIRAKSKINKTGKRIVNIECEISNYDGSKILARGYSNLIKVS